MGFEQRDQTGVLSPKRYPFIAIRHDPYPARRPSMLSPTHSLCRAAGSATASLEELARDYAGRLKVVKVEMDQNPKIAIACRVLSAPTLLLFKNGAVQVTQFGIVPESALVGMVEATLVGLKVHRPARLGAPHGRRPARVSAARFRACRPR